jgi:hypothetical protein
MKKRKITPLIFLCIISLYSNPNPTKNHHKQHFPRSLALEISHKQNSINTFHHSKKIYTDFYTLFLKFSEKKKKINTKFIRTAFDLPSFKKTTLNFYSHNKFQTIHKTIPTLFHSYLKTIKTKHNQLFFTIFSQFQPNKKSQVFFTTKNKTQSFSKPNLTNLSTFHSNKNHSTLFHKKKKKISLFNPKTFKSFHI